MSNKNKVFTVAVKVVLDTDVEISAATFEDALEKARELSITDIVDFDGSHIDSNVDITGIFQ
jgi:hypothetical protein